MKLWKRIQNWIVKPYMKPLKLKKQWEIDLKGLKNKQFLGRRFDMENLLARLNFKWQNFIEDMFGMGNFNCPTYKRELKKNKNKSSHQSLTMPA